MTKQIETTPYSDAEYIRCMKQPYLGTEIKSFNEQAERLEKIAKRLEELTEPKPISPNPFREFGYKAGWNDAIVEAIKIITLYRIGGSKALVKISRRIECLKKQ